MQHLFDYPMVELLSIFEGIDKQDAKKAYTLPRLEVDLEEDDNKD